MRYAVCKIGQIPVRLSPSEKAEMTNQLLFGEQCEILEEQNTWLLIRSLYDAYEGWISGSFASEFLKFSENKPEQPQFVVSSPTAQLISANNTMLISFGSWLGTSDKIAGGEQILFHPEQPDKDALLSYANQLLGAPYLWGGRTIFGMDCSGFIQLIYKVIGIYLPRDASQQALVGNTLNFIEEAQIGDLAFFDNEEGKITHVALFTDTKHVIHASGFVRIDPIDHHGIYNVSQQNYSHKLRIIKRI